MTDGTFTQVDARGGKYLTAAERGRFLAAARSHPKPAVQTLARTLAMTGCRVSEALGLRASDVDLKANELRLATRPLWPVTRQTANRQVGAIMRTSGIEGPQGCPRGLRHSYGVAAGVPLPTIATVLGHVSLTTTAICTTAIGAEARELVSRVWA